MKKNKILVILTVLLILSVLSGCENMIKTSGKVIEDCSADNCPACDSEVGCSEAGEPCFWDPMGICISPPGDDELCIMGGGMLVDDNCIYPECSEAGENDEACNGGVCAPEENGILVCWTIPPVDCPMSDCPVNDELDDITGAAIMDITGADILGGTGRVCKAIGNGIVECGKGTGKVTVNACKFAVNNIPEIEKLRNMSRNCKEAEGMWETTKEAVGGTCGWAGTCVINQVIDIFDDPYFLIMERMNKSLNYKQEICKKLIHFLQTAVTGGKFMIPVPGGGAVAGKMYDMAIDDNLRVMCGIGVPSEPPADEPPADEPPADEPPADEPPADEPPADEPPPE